MVIQQFLKRKTHLKRRKGEHMKQKRIVALVLAQGRKGKTPAFSPDFAMDEKLLCAFFVLSFFLWGGVYEVVSAVYSVLCLCLIAVRIKASGSMKLPVGTGFFCLAGLLLLSLISVLYAVDWGMALIGFMKFLPVPLFVIAVYQMGERVKERCILLMPAICAVMTVVCGIFYVTPWRDYFFVAGRMGGFCNYPNVFALTTLLSLLILLDKKELSYREILMGLICGAGLLLSGSRSVFVLFACCMVLALFKKRQRKRAAGLAAFIMAMGIAGAALLGNFQGFTRFSTIFSHNSTFWGRLLYWQDALRIIREHPWGLGYKGYYFIQGRYATGNYVTMFAHNEWLQSMLDFGIAAGILLGIMLFVSFRSERISGQKKFLLAIIVLHSLFDFDMQFIAAAFFACLLMDFGQAKVIPSSFHIKAAISVMLAVSLYFSLVLGLAFGNQHAAALKLYPVLTFSEIERINEVESSDDKNRLAEHILERNESCAAIYRLKTGWAAGQGDFAAMEDYAWKAIGLEPYNAENYEIYIQGLSVALQNAVLQKDEALTRHYMDQVVGIEQQMKERERESSPLALKIQDTPKVELGDSYLTYIEQMKQIKAKSLERK